MTETQATEPTSDVVVEGTAEEVSATPPEPDPQPQATVETHDLPQHTPPASQELVPRPTREALTPLDPEQVVAGMTAYQELLPKLLVQSDYQDAGSDGKGGRKHFVKKSGWRKIARAFNLSVELISSRVFRDEHGEVQRAEVVARAIAPNGQVQDGDGYCCLPLDAEILTRSGWLRYDEVKPGLEVLGYDVVSDSCDWTVLRHVHVYDDAPRVRLTHSRFTAVCTPSHTWAVQKPKRAIGPRTTPREMRTADNLGAGGIVLAAQAAAGDHPLSPRDAAVLGWILTDGWLTWERGHPRAGISQAKDPYVDEIRGLVGADAVSEHTRPPGEATIKGTTYATRALHTFRLRAGYVRWLVEATGVRHESVAPAFVTRLSGAAREAMLDAMLKADGTCNRGRWEFAKSSRAVLDTFQVLATLQGYALGRERQAANSAVKLQHLRTTRHVHALRVEPEFPGSVWCPTTDRGTWVARLDGQIFITGNSIDEDRFSGPRGNKSKLENDLRATATTRAKNRAISDLVGMGEVSAEEAENRTGAGADPPASPELVEAAKQACRDLGGVHARELWGKVAPGDSLPRAVGTALVYAAAANQAAVNATAATDVPASTEGLPV